MYIVYKNDFYLLVTAGIERFFEQIKTSQPDLVVTIKKDCTLKRVKISECVDHTVYRNT